MNDQPPRHTPTAIQLHQKSRILSLTFEDGRHFELPCEYLRVASRAAEVRASNQPVIGKESVNITAIEPQGNYALRLIFDDGHDTGLYSWDTLYQLGENQAQNWAAYLERLRSFGYQRHEEIGPRRVTVLYFAHLAQRLRRESDILDLPESVRTVADLLLWLCRRQPAAAPLFAAEQVRVTVNRQFAESFTRLEQGDEIGLVPRSPIAPPTPGLV